MGSMAFERSCLESMGRNGKEGVQCLGTCKWGWTENNFMQEEYDLGVFHTHSWRHNLNQAKTSECSHTFYFKMRWAKTWVC